jgi:hypothetical protein
MTQRVEIGPGTYPVRNTVTGIATNFTVPTLTVAIAQASPSVGQTLSLTTNAAAGAGYQWRRGASDIAGATAATYVAQAADAGQSVSCRVTSGAQVVTSAGVTVGGAAAFRVDFRGVSRTNSGGNPLTVTSVPVGPAVERNRIYVVAMMAHGEQPPPSATATLGGQSGTLVQLIQGSGFEQGRLVRTEIWLFTNVTGDSPVSFVHTSAVGGPSDGLHVAAYSALGVNSINIVTDNTAASNLVDVSQSLVPGDVVIAAVNFREQDFNNSGWTDSGNVATVGVTENFDRNLTTASARSAVAGGIHAATATETRTFTFAVPTAPVVRDVSAFSMRLRGA